MCQRTASGGLPIPADVQIGPRRSDGCSGAAGAVIRAAQRRPPALPGSFSKPDIRLQFLSDVGAPLSRATGIAVIRQDEPLAKDCFCQRLAQPLDRTKFLDSPILSCLPNYTCCHFNFVEDPSIPQSWNMTSNDRVRRQGWRGREDLQVIVRKGGAEWSGALAHRTAAMALHDNPASQPFNTPAHSHFERLHLQSCSASVQPQGWRNLD